MMTDTWTWATVTAVSPLRIKVDGDTSALDATTDDLVGSLAVDDRVRVHLHSDGIIVAGVQGGGAPEATAATPNTLALRDGDGQLKAADGVAADDVATVGQLSVAASLPDAVDLDDYTTPGLWHQDSNARAATGTNYPAPYAGLLEVFNGTQSGTFVYQRYTTYGTQIAVYQRTFYGGTWYGWNLVGGNDTGWVDITVRAGFAANSTSERPQVRKKNGFILSKGLFANTGMAANGSYTVGDLPSGFAPPVNVIGRTGTSSGGTTASLFFTSGGSVIIRTSGTLSGYYGIGGYTWTTD